MGGKFIGGKIRVVRMIGRDERRSRVSKDSGRVAPI